jgi:hypothetical protein
MKSFHKFLALRSKNENGDWVELPLSREDGKL